MCTAERPGAAADERCGRVSGGGTRRTAVGAAERVCGCARAWGSRPRSPRGERGRLTRRHRPPTPPSMDRQWPRQTPPVWLWMSRADQNVRFLVVNRETCVYISQSAGFHDSEKNTPRSAQLTGADPLVRIFAPTPTQVRTRVMTRSWYPPPHDAFRTPRRVPITAP